MSSIRKLQGEIDKTLKKVQEGLGVFDEIWEQLYSTDNINQRDKHEANLKTEIKKLQRFREQIKTWHANNDIKDKTALADARSNIERRMEKFKICEKEAKTKAFSKEGLQNAASRMDPKEKAKHEMREWLNDTVDKLNTQIEEFEAEIEELGSSGKKKGKVPPRVTHLEESIVRHRQHIARLEQMLRLLDNDEITAEDVELIKDLVDDYIDRNQEDPEEFAIPDELYADVLDVLENMSEAVVAAPPSHAKTSAKDRELAKEKEREEKERERQKAAALAAKAQLAAQGNTRLMTETEDEKKLPGTPAAAAKPVAPPAPPAPFAPGGPGQPTAASIVAAAPPPPPPPPPRAPGSKDSPAAVGPAGSAPSTPLRGQGVGTPTASPLTSSSGTTPAGALGQGESFSALGGSAAAAGNGVKQLPVGHAANPNAGAAAAEDATNFDAGAMDSGLEQLASQLGSMGIQDGTAGLSPAQCLQLLQAAAPRSIPQPSDSTWQQLPLRPRPPPVAPPPSYPTSRLPVFDNPALFEKLDSESLFFAFYQQPGSYQQYLAARSLKQQAWRFHKQHQAWFQRHDEPKSGGQPGDDWEQGSYVYFDNLLREPADASSGGAPAGWVYRLKNEFLFKYDALEDELNV